MVVTVSLPAPGCSVVQAVNGRAWTTHYVALPFDAVTALYDAGGKWVVLPVIYGLSADEPWVDPLRLRRKTMHVWEPMRYSDEDVAMACEQAITKAVHAMPNVFAAAMSKVPGGIEAR